MLLRNNIINLSVKSINIGLISLVLTNSTDAQENFSQNTIAASDACETSFLASLTQSERLPEKDTKQAKPNIVFFLVDDLGWSDVGFNGAKYYETPNVDMFASEGMKFTQAYAAPVCSPTRASIMTGKYPARVRITDAILDEKFIVKDRKLLSPKVLKELPLEEFTLAEALKEAGYVTGSIGKWHLGGEGFLPTDQGFDVNVSGCHRGQPLNYFYPFNRDYESGKMIPDAFPNLKKGKKGDHLSDVLTEEALGFIEDNKDEPFFLYFPFYSVHWPIQAKEELIDKYSNKEMDRDDTRPAYAGMIETMDLNVGKVLDKLDELNLSDNTVVIFMSDNGGCYSNTPLRGKKGQVYEGGIREPLIIKWPGVTRPNSVCNIPVISNDFYPTLLTIAGCSQLPQQHLDGKDITPLLKGDSDIGRETLFWYYPHSSLWIPHIEPVEAVREGDWKLIHFMEQDKYELYNLKDDIGEQNNLKDESPDKVNNMKKLIIDWKKSVNAIEPTINPEYSNH